MKYLKNKLINKRKWMCLEVKNREFLMHELHGERTGGIQKKWEQRVQGGDNIKKKKAEQILAIIFIFYSQER